MKFSWLRKDDSPHLLIFYNGWGMDEQVVRHLESDNMDICACHDYREVPSDAPDHWSNYRRITIIAWSLGVTVANWHLSKLDLPVTRTIAINGTLSPINDRFGIPEAIYWGTHESLNKKNLEKFFKRMCGDTTSFEKFQDRAPRRRIEEQQEELVALANLSRKAVDKPPKWHHAVSAKNDRIFPFKNQRFFWKQYRHATISELNTAHFPFFHWTSWTQLIEHTMTNRSDG